MPARALTLAEVAAELGRSDDWLARHWRRLRADDQFPAPLHEPAAGSTAVWSAAQVYAWMDRMLSPEQRAYAAAFRAALEAARLPAPIAVDDGVTSARLRLEARYSAGPPAR